MFAVGWIGVATLRDPVYVDSDMHCLSRHATRRLCVRSSLALGAAPHAPVAALLLTKINACSKLKREKGIMRLQFAQLVLICSAAIVAASAATGQTLLDIHKNAGVPCTACHSEEPAAVPPPNDICVACHGTMLESEDAGEASRPDPHLSLQLQPEETPPCTTCHSVHGTKN
jgi:hypothetical protein